MICVIDVAAPFYAMPRFTQHAFIISRHQPMRHDPMPAAMFADAPAQTAFNTPVAAIRRLCFTPDVVIFAPYFMPRPRYKTFSY